MSFKTLKESGAAVSYAFNPSTWEADTVCGSETSMVYRVSSRTVMATQRNCILKTRQRQRERDREEQPGASGRVQSRGRKKTE